ncbi:14609_t:CDS:1 [Funneliformis mosseae]|uniref:14609_t:CDS:1 n=1 Tax=Funneliformis mosseae TaxID=27381 RepID=A0A9N9EZD2_FUNMO|nr:14609_t:CDS:1 [Funneliformis mosseae]
MSNPWELMYEDFVWIFSHPYEVLIEFAFRNTILAMHFDYIKDEKTPKGEFNLLYWSNWRGLLSQIWLFFITLPIFFVYPYFAMKALERPYVRMPAPPTTDEERKIDEKEKWFFINGVMVNEDWLDENCKYLEARFGKKVIGILNSSYGLFWDVVETVLQRSFEIDTMSVRQATNYILPSLRDKKTETVRLISHSQGGVLANLVIKRLYTELSYTKEQGNMRKLSVHTFANISREFGNPDGLINCIEHYANRRDPVAIRGIINNINDKRTIGEIFINDVRNGGKGHLFNSFYSLNLDDYFSARGGDAVLLNLPGKVDHLPIKVVI